MDAHQGWQRNLIAITVAVFIGFTGFTLVMPFLPLYLHDLGLTDVGDIAFWAGISLGITPAVTAVLSPFWGRLADRFGRKVMVARSLGSFVVVMVALAYVTQPWQVFALRLAQGFFAGYGTLALAMVADSAPPDRLASSIGLIQSAQRLGPAFGPVIGGAVAQLVGRRNAFLVSAGIYLLGFVLLLAFYKERRSPHSATAGTANAVAPAAVAFRSVLAFENFILLMVVIFGLQFVDRSFGPVLALHLAGLGMTADRVTVLSGVIFSLVAVAGAIGNTLCAPLLDRYQPRILIGISSIVGALATAAFAVGSAVGLWYGAAVVFGFALGVAMTAAYTAGGSVMPLEGRGTGFGLLASASLAAMAVGPMAAGILARTSIRGVFVVDAVVMAGVALLVSRLMAERSTRTAVPIADEV